MDEKQLESQSRLLIELGEPETWLETMLRASRRSAMHEASTGNDELAKRWRKLTRSLEHVVAMTVNEPNADGETATELREARKVLSAYDQLVDDLRAENAALKGKAASGGQAEPQQQAQAQTDDAA